ncbi:TIM barrel protein [Aestuariicella hydrocarbonica]|uniref:TIM barrel protein n=1 Tax=Pseudomaricurvus hydrocarbonicus TaxID=1470433 RepID=A0A9E5T3R7_9GAMM|nr:TIM barrel protein [Aestuariicella hydrocarbonica]NHO67398.1 TIM barrel protein [Aestuariicella hydrocarbonica]
MTTKTHQEKKPYRGVSLYCYAEELGFTMTMEDCFADMYDMGATGLEILANGHIENYPNPTDEWLENWFSLLKKYEIEPVEYGHWVDSRLVPGQQLSTKDSYDMLVKDIKLASKLGFSVMRTKLGVVDEILTPVPNWQEFIEMALPVAEEYNVKMCPELHQPTPLKSAMVDEYVEFIERTGTKHFGLNIDFGVFQSPEGRLQIPGVDNPPSAPEDMIALLPYTYACHAKFTHMTEDFIDPTHPYDEIIKILIQEKWDGCLLSEYEGGNRSVPGYTSDQLRKQHVMMRRLLGEI